MEEVRASSPVHAAGSLKFMQVLQKSKTRGGG